MKSTSKSLLPLQAWRSLPDGLGKSPVETGLKLPSLEFVGLRMHLPDGCDLYKCSPAFDLEEQLFGIFGL